MNAVEYFLQVREMPYRIATTPEEVDRSCYTKHVILKEYLESIDVVVRPIIRVFDWERVVPSKLLEIPHSDKGHHLYLQFKNGGWHDLDATFDSGLAGKLVVNEWDGESSTGVAVPGKDYPAFLSKKLFEKPFDVVAELRVNGEFYKAANKWFDRLRDQ